MSLVALLDSRSFRPSLAGSVTPRGRARWLFMALVACHLLGAGIGPAEARRARPAPLVPRVLHVLDTETRFKPPTFFKVRPVRGVDGGRLVYYGKGALGERDKLILWDVANQKTLNVTAPLAAYVASHRQRFPGHPKRPNDSPYMVGDLLAYDTTTEEAYVLAWDDYDNPQRRRRFTLFRWDLKADRITHAFEVARMSSDVKWITVKAVGYDPAQQTVYAYVNTKQGESGDSAYLHEVVAISARGQRSVARFQSPRHVSDGIFFDPPRGRVLLAEYAEKAASSPPPRGHLVDLKTGQVHGIPVPLTTYGVAFAEDGASLYAFSAEMGVISAIDTKSGRTIRSVKVGTLGHSLGHLDERRLCLIRNAALHVISLPDLKVTQTIPMSRIYSGYSHVQGSAVIGGTLYVTGRDKLHVVRLSAP